MRESELISKEFLEQALGENIESYIIRPVSDTGDNFMSILYTLDVNIMSTDGKIDTIYLLSKCYPRNPGRQEFLNGQNMFWKELQVYKEFIPEIIKFQDELDLDENIKLDVPTFAAGNAINFQETGNDFSGQIFKPFDNYIMMVDLKRTWGYKMADRLVGLNFDHMSLAVEAQAKLHALSWTYKKKNNINSILEKFPTMTYDYTVEKDRKMFHQMISSNTKIGIEALKSGVGKTSHLITALTYFQKLVESNDIFYKYGNETDIFFDQLFRVKPKTYLLTETPWSVVTHGDSHVSNMLFRYNTLTQKPEEVILVDLQLVQESCPTTDLVYLLYSSTSAEFRKEYSDEILNIYFEKFNHFCKLLKIDVFPAFTLQELKRRFHRKKIFGLCIALVLLPHLLKERENAVQLDDMEDMPQADIFAAVSEGTGSNTIFAKRFTELMQEMYDDGVV